MESPTDDGSALFGCFGASRESKPSRDGGHVRSSSSSFSRWWNTGAGTSTDDTSMHPSEGEGTTDLLARISDDLLAIDLDAQSQPSVAPTEPKPTHERKRSWPFSVGRKVVPQPGDPSVATPTTLDALPATTATTTTPSDEGSTSPVTSTDPRTSSHSFSIEDSASLSLPSFSERSETETPTSIAAAAAAAVAAGTLADASAAATAAATNESGDRPQGYRRLWQSITSVRKGDKVTAKELPPPPQEFTVESLVRAVMALKPAQPIMQATRLSAGLRTLDSRAVAALLKELSKAGAQHRASELFDYLRALPDDHELAPLADLYTYTTVISQCGGHQHLRRALELVAEMRGRGIQCNVHTYSALMSVCVKCNECELALDVYDQLLSEGCTANLVTYNILIDAFSRTGQWSKAADVLDPISRQGLTPEARTYNSIISACGKAGQPQAALRVYERMLDDGVDPTGTTYTLIISAFGRAGLVDEALKMYKDMSARGCEPNVITYSSLISVCERAGRAETALLLFEEMKTAGVRPNVVTFNGLVGACAHAGMWQKALELVEAMPSAGCRPDGATYSVLVAALERGGQWRQSLQALEKAQAAGLRPDAGAYNAVLGALWSSGRLSAWTKAVQLVTAAQRQGAIRLQSVSAGEATATAYTQGAAVLITLRWLCHFRDGLSAAAAFAANPAMRSLLLVKGKHTGPVHSFEPICESMNGMFAAFSVPASASAAPQGLLIRADARQLPSWAASASGLALLSILDYANGAPSQSASTLLKEDRTAESQCGKAFNAVREFEGTHCVQTLDPEALCTPAATALRHDVITCITALSSGMQLREDTAHDAVQLCNRLLSIGSVTQQPPPPACAAALLLLACRQAGNAAAMLRHGQLVLQAAGLPVSAVLEAEQRILGTLGSDPAAISPLRVLHLYLERLGCDDSALQKCQLAHVMSLTATDVVAKAALSPAFVRFDPSVVAAACLLKARQSMGLSPAWPLVLQDMTGYVPGSTMALDQCVELLQLLGIAQ